LRAKTGWVEQLNRGDVPVAESRLLHIDDDPYVGKAFALVARACGYETKTTSHSSDFKSAYEAFKPHVIVCDLAMPNVDGIELLRYLADAGCEAKILIVSGLDRRVLDAAGRLAAARGLNIAGTLNKPVQAADLRLALNGVKTGLDSNG
jgi:CheY-like chemotaxis protein